MGKMKKIVLIMLFFGICLGGCSKNKPSPNLVCSFSKEYDGITTDYLDTYENNGTKITKSTFIEKYTSENQETITFIKESMSLIDTSASYNVEGVTYAIMEIENGVQITIVFDLSVVSNDDLVTLGFISSKDKDADYIGVEVTKEYLVSAGYSCSYDE